MKTIKNYLTRKITTALCCMGMMMGLQANAAPTPVVCHLHSSDKVALYDESCDKPTFAFQNVTQTFTAPFSGFITEVRAGIGDLNSQTAYGTTISDANTAVSVNYGTLPYSPRNIYPYS